MPTPVAAKCLQHYSLRSSLQENGLPLSGRPLTACRGATALSSRGSPSPGGAGAGAAGERETGAVAARSYRHHRTAHLRGGAHPDARPGDAGSCCVPARSGSSAVTDAYNLRLVSSSLVDDGILSRLKSLSFVPSTTVLQVPGFLQRLTLIRGHAQPPLSPLKGRNSSPVVPPRRMAEDRSRLRQLSPRGRPPFGPLCAGLGVNLRWPA